MKRPFPRRHFLGTCGAFGTTLTGSLSCRVIAAETYTMRMSVSTPATGVYGLAALRFAQAVRNRTSGQVTIEVYPNAQLGSERESIDGLVSGVLDFAVQSTIFLVPLFPNFGVWDMPFLVRDLAASYRVLDGPIGDEFLAQLESKGILGLCWGTGGLKNLETTTKPVIVPEDMKGLRVRIPNSTIQVATYQALGATPVTIDLSETLPALLQHTVDGVDIPLDTIVTAKYYTAVRHVAMLNYLLAVNMILGSKKKIEALPAALQRIVKEEGKATVAYWRSTYVKNFATAVAFLKSNGVAFTEIQYAPFRKAMDPVYAAFQPKFGNLVERIVRAAGNG